jgi:hypothetical protein
VVEKSANTVEAITAAMSQHFMLSLVRDIRPVLDSMQLIVANPGDVLIWQVSAIDVL